MADNVDVRKSKNTRLLDRFTKKKPEFKSYKIDLASDVHERLEKLATETGMSKEAINDALNYAIRKLVAQLEREAKQYGAAGDSAVAQ